MTAARDRARLSAARPTTDYRFTTPAFSIHCGRTALAALPHELARAGAERAVVVCGASIASSPALALVEAALGPRLAGCFTAASEHSPVSVVEAARDRLTQLRADAVVAVGGGSAVVTSRAAVILLGERAEVRQLCTHRDHKGQLISPRLSAPKLPLWVVPSTPSTAMATAGAAVRDPRTGERLALYDPKARARGVFLDATVAASAPPALVRSAALNAFVMAVDALQGAVDPIAEALLTQAVRLLADGLALRRDIGHPAARLKLMSAALLSGYGSSQRGTGSIVQALAHAAGPRSAVANGVIEALLVPHVLAFNAGASSVDDPADNGLALMRRLVDDVLEAAGGPRRLRDVGVSVGDFAAIVDQAQDDWAIVAPPRPADRHQLLAILEAAW